VLVTGQQLADREPMRFARDPARGLLDPVAGLPKLLDEPAQLLAILLDVLS